MQEALTADELDVEWRAVFKKEKERVDATQVAIDGLLETHEIQC